MSLWTWGTTGIDQGMDQIDCKEQRTKDASEGREDSGRAVVLRHPEDSLLPSKKSPRPNPQRSAPVEEGGEVPAPRSPTLGSGKGRGKTRWTRRGGRLFLGHARRDGKTLGERGRGCVCVMATRLKRANLRVISSWMANQRILVNVLANCWTIIFFGLPKK